MKQIAIKKISGKIVVKTGLHIGAGNEEVHIGGVDSPIMRNPLNLEPYIPGSSIKGKMRSLMEWKLNRINMENDELGSVCSCNEGNADETINSGSDFFSASRNFFTASSPSWFAIPQTICPQIVSPFKGVTREDFNFSDAL